MSNQSDKTFQQIWKHMDRERRQQTAAAFFSSTETAGEMRRISGFIAMFLDELHIPHQNGVIADDSTAVPSADALRAAADHLRAAFPAADVQFYLSALLASDAVAWANLGAAFTDAALTDEKP